MISKYNLAFSWKNTKFPVEKFIDLTLMNNAQSLKKYTDNNILTIDQDQNIIFDRKNYKKCLPINNKSIVMRERLTHIEKELSDADTENKLLRRSFENTKPTSVLNWFDDLDFENKLIL